MPIIEHISDSDKKYLYKSIMINLCSKVKLCNKCTLRTLTTKLLKKIKEIEYKDIDKFSNYVQYYCNIKKCCLCSLDSWETIVVESNKHRILNNKFNTNQLFCRCNPEKPHFYNINESLQTKYCQLGSLVISVISQEYLYSPHHYINDFSDTSELFISCRRYARKPKRINNNIEEPNMIQYIGFEDEYPDVEEYETENVFNYNNLNANVNSNINLHLYLHIYNDVSDWIDTKNDINLYQSICHLLLVNNMKCSLLERRNQNAKRQKLI